MNHQVNILINGVPAGQQTIVGSPINMNNVAPTSRVLVNGVAVEEGQKEEDMPTLKPNIASLTVGNDKYLDEDCFSIAENYTQWSNLKKNLSLDKMFLVSSPGSQEKLVELHKYITDLLFGDANIPDEIKYNEDLIREEIKQEQEELLQEAEGPEPEYLAVKEEDVIPRKGRIPKSNKPTVEETQELKRLKFEAEKAAFLEQQALKGKKKNLKTDL